MYILGNSQGFPRYVGRSDDDVRSRLLAHARAGEYRFFVVEHKRDSTEAFLRECGLYHYFRNQIDNKIHPQRPARCGDNCPRCSYYH